MSNPNIMNLKRENIPDWISSNKGHIEEVGKYIERALKSSHEKELREIVAPGTAFAIAEAYRFGAKVGKELYMHLKARVKEFTPGTQQILIKALFSEAKYLSEQKMLYGSAHLADIGEDLEAMLYQGPFPESDIEKISLKYVKAFVWKNKDQIHEIMKVMKHALNRGTDDQLEKKIAPGIALAFVYSYFLDRKLADHFLHDLQKIVREGTFLQKNIIIVALLERLNEAAGHGRLELGTFLAESITKISETEQTHIASIKTG